MTDPFKIDGPTVASFSGGRTSGYLLRRVIDANPASVIKENLRTCFANTGREDEATLRFVDRCAREWGIDITWLEFVSRSGEERHRVVDFATASRNGEPFERLIDDKSHLPNPVMRFCTEELKIKPIKHFTGLGEDDTMVGVRADESVRIAKLRARGLCLPLVDAGIVKQDVRNFWNAQPFDLELEERNGVTPWGNCDFCYLKGARQLQSMAAVRQPVWWAKQEQRTGATFRSDRPSYTAMMDFARDQGDMFAGDGIDCFCGE